jgi:hypothetical protein
MQVELDGKAFYIPIERSGSIPKPCSNKKAL